MCNEFDQIEGFETPEAGTVQRADAVVRYLELVKNHSPEALEDLPNLTEAEIEEIIDLACSIAHLDKWNTDKDPSLILRRLSRLEGKIDLLLTLVKEGRKAADGIAHALLLLVETEVEGRYPAPADVAAVQRRILTALGIGNSQPDEAA